MMKSARRTDVIGRHACCHGPAYFDVMSTSPILKWMRTRRRLLTCGYASVVEEPVRSTRWDAVVV